MRGTSVLLFLTLSSCVLFSAKPARADSAASVLPLNVYGCPLGNGQYEFIAGVGDFWCGYPISLSQSDDLVTVSSGLYGADAWEDTGGAWTFNLSDLHITGDPYDYAVAYATSPVSVPINPDRTSFETNNFLASLYVAGVPLDQPSTDTPEPASFGLIALAVLILPVAQHRRDISACRNEERE